MIHSFHHYKKVTMNRILILTTSFIVLLGMSSQAQQAPQYSLYMFNQHNFNAAYAGMENSISATGVFRKQWQGFEGSPTTQSLNIHTPILFLGSGVGLKLENDVLGAERNVTISASYAYHLPLSRTSTLSLGLSGGVTQKTLDGSLLNPPDQDQIDNLIPQGIASAFAPVVGVGAYFKNENIEAGLSANNILQTSLIYPFNPQSGFQFFRNYFFIFAYNFEFGSNLALEPSILVKSDIIETQIDFSAILYYNDNIFGGASFRGYSENTFDAVMMMVGLKVSPNVTFAYGYDLSIFQLNGFNNGSHEIMINYNLNQDIGKPRPAKIIYNPRFLFN